MQLIAHPFRVGPTGQVQTLTQGSDAHLADAVARITLTRPGELTLAPGYGLPDPAFEPASADPGGSVTGARINAVLAQYGPGARVQVLAVTRSARSQTLQLRVAGDDEALAVVA